MQVEIWSDVACPWCYVGKRHLEGALEIVLRLAGEPDDEIGGDREIVNVEPCATQFLHVALNAVTAAHRL